MNDPVEWGKSVAVMVKGFVAKAADALTARMDALEQKLAAIPAGKDGAAGQDGKDGDPGANGIDGQDGKDGTSVTADDVMPELLDAFAKAVAKAVAEIPLPKDGAPGKDGTSVTIDGMRQLFETEQAKWALDFERRAQDVLQRAVERMPEPKVGKDGRDAFELDDFDFELKDGGRVIVLRMKAGDAVIEREKITELPVFRDTWKEVSTYLPGDEVTWAGSTWIARKETHTKPETDDSWRLRTKRGRDGKPGENGKDFIPSKPVKLP